MPQKYALYLNRKALLFNNSQGIHPQVDIIKTFDGSTEVTLFQALDWIQRSENEDATAYLADINMEFAQPLLKTRFKFLRAAGGIVQAHSGEILFIHRLGCWDLPKGKVEDGESLEQAASREITEETGIELLENQKFLCSTWHTYQHKGKDILKETTWYSFTTPETSETIPQTEEDISSAEWLGADRICEVVNNTYPSIIDVIEAFQNESTRP
jgi:8-oxo-dGTP pyrophosphatase MutT (NUDIX family)